MRQFIVLVVAVIFGSIVFVSLESRNVEPCHDHIPNPRCYHDAKLIVEKGVAVCRCEDEEEPDNP